MANPVTNATGWSELMNGDMVSAVYTMFDSFLGGGGVFVILLFFLYQFMLYQKTGNLTLMFVTGLMFASLFGLTRFFESSATVVMFTLLLLEAAGIIYLMFKPRR